MAAHAGADAAIRVLSLQELQLAARNHGMPLEALRFPITPVGLHYLLVHYDIPVVDPATWRLELAGRVARPLSLTLEELRGREATELVATMECAGNGRALLTPHVQSQPWLLEAVGTGRWRGVAVAPLLAEAGLLDDALEVVFTGLDRGIEGGVEQSYQRSVPVAELERAVLAWELNGDALPPQHGYPLRLVVPGWYGMTNVKWLASLEAVAEPFAGYQQSHSYRLRQTEDEDGDAVTRMRPRSLLVPPGIPEFFSRERSVPLGECLLEGRAWSGTAAIARVEVSDDAGATWADAELGDDPGAPWAWRAWRHTWRPAAPGEYVLCCRATDASGEAQPVEPPWNLGGYANNAVQRVPVTVVPG